MVWYFVFISFLFLSHIMSHINLGDSLLVILYISTASALTCRLWIVEEPSFDKSFSKLDLQSSLLIRLLSIRPQIIHRSGQSLNRDTKNVFIKSFVLRNTFTITFSSSCYGGKFLLCLFKHYFMWP